MSNHKTTAEKLPPRMRANSVEIDERIVPLIRELWKCGFVTRFSCQGDADRGETGVAAAYVMFRTPLEASLFAALAGPLAWDKRAHRKREIEKPAAISRWTWDWYLTGKTVRFPARDIPRASAALERGKPRLAALIQQVSDAAVPALPDLPLCHRCGSERIIITETESDAHRSARVCPTCGEVVLTRRKDALYCSRRCQLSARDRRK